MRADHLKGQRLFPVMHPYRSREEDDVGEGSPQFRITDRRQPEVLDHVHSIARVLSSNGPGENNIDEETVSAMVAMVPRFNSLLFSSSALDSGRFSKQKLMDLTSAEHRDYDVYYSVDHVSLIIAFRGLNYRYHTSPLYRFGMGMYQALGRFVF
ncbi:hypothetical protein PROFUN_03891 [Planoprotostelium fungivorum]|uniref:Uncharacterized protein n=1 Tax=Planoprotostelium fungivorum TaxID=1890364 RepID=A0A2P6MTM6_9EUKA|nr:hypothetical protein PROFUN_03891 [Planoprotostelium fungivorum]